jgi:hypothetical protein
LLKGLSDWQRPVPAGGLLGNWPDWRNRTRSPMHVTGGWGLLGNLPDRGIEPGSPMHVTGGWGLLGNLPDWQRSVPMVRGNWESSGLTSFPVTIWNLCTASPVREIVCKVKGRYQVGLMKCLLRQR